MKTKTIRTLGTTLFVVFVMTGIAGAWSGRDVIIGLPLLILLFDLVDELAGVAAVIGAGILAHEYKHMLPFANLVAGVGGALSANRFFGWPWITQLEWVRPAFANSRRVPVETFSLAALLGCVLFALIGIAICSAIAKSQQDQQASKS